MFTRMTLSEAFDLYRLDAIVYGNQSSGIEEKHMYALTNLLEFLEDDFDIGQLTLPQVREWKRQLDKGRSIGTVSEYLTRLRMVLKYAREEGNECLNYRLIRLPKREKPNPDFLTVDQVQELIESVFQPVRGYSKLNRYRNRALISLLFAAGLRSAELRSLNRDSIRSDGTFSMRGKGKKVRLCFVDAPTMLYIEEYLALRTDSNIALFISDQTGKRLSKSTFQRIFKFAQKKVSFTIPLHGHVVRHSFATDLLRNGANLRYVQEMLGHESIQTTQIYTHVVDADLKRQHDSFHSVLPIHARGAPIH